MLNLSIFKKVNVKSKNFDAKLLEALEGQQLFFTFKWTKGGPLLLFELISELNGGSGIDALNGSAIKDTDGDISVLIGTFQKGDKLKITFGVKAFEDIPQSLATIIQTNPNTILDKNPKNGFKSLEAGENWEDKFSITII